MNQSIPGYIGEPITIHCTSCHGEHLRGTSYICYPRDITSCSKCNDRNKENREKSYKYCPHCGKHL